MHPVEAIDNGRLSRDLLLLADGDEGQIETYRRTARFFACLREGAVKGQIGVRENTPEEAEVVSLAVEEGEQNGGMGTALLEHVIAWAGRPWDHWQFSYGEKLPNRLLILVMTGKKRGTSSALELYEPGEEKPRAGALSLVTWGNGIPGCVIEAEEILIRPFCEITGEEARLEGEGDLSLEYWRRVHGDHFRREYGEAGKIFHDNIPVIFERFRVIFRRDGLNC